ncbi:MAG: ribonuclease VapC [Candidatus Bathyarchaeota archaeon]|nr:MAG: ribonuclease VapC [Candidatus Bathyarchaeota archaeon]
MEKEPAKQKIIVLDTSAFIAGFEPLSIQIPQFSVPEVKEELAVDSLPRTRFDAAVENGKLKIKTPQSEFVEKARRSAKIVGDLSFLSDADMQVLALALEIKDSGYRSQIVTDDYSIQNVANQLGIEFTPLITFGIKYRFRWILYCPACHNKYSADYQSKYCRICGEVLKRKPRRKTQLQN